MGASLFAAPICCSRLKTVRSVADQLHHVRDRKAPAQPGFFFAMRCEQVPGPTAQTNLLHKVILIMCSVQVCAPSFGRGGEAEVPRRIDLLSPPKRALP